jgi:hypothetical protein
LSRLKALFCVGAIAFIVPFCGGCGLPDPVGEPPKEPDQNKVSYASGTGNAVDRYFEFTPIDFSSPPPYGGTKVFYRIYASQNTLDSDIATIKTAIQSEIDTKVAQGSYNRIVSLGYKELDTNRHENYLTDGGAKIRIRIFDEGFNSNSGMWAAGVFTGGNIADDDRPTLPTVIPLRRGLDNKGFNFFFTDPTGIEANPVPVSGDTDTSYSGYTEGSNKWYVNAYAVSVGQDISFALSYSRIVELGYIIISQSGI